MRIAEKIKLFNEAYKAGWTLLEADNQLATSYTPETAVRLRPTLDAAIARFIELLTVAHRTPGTG